MNTKEKNFKNQSSVEKDILPFLSYNIRSILTQINQNKTDCFEEIRLRAEKPLMIQGSNIDWFVDKDGKLTEKADNPYIVGQEDIVKTLELMSENSIYAYQEEIRSGFITLKGGHRVGICGKAVIEGNYVKNIKDISGMNIRLSKEISGCSSGIIRFILDSNKSVYNTLIVSPPQCGKTTILRDIARTISDGTLSFKGLKVGIVDERSEIAACYRGIPQNNVGVRTDVLDGCPKTVGMSMMLRSMSPQVMITDEIGNQGDKEAVMKVINAGIKIITTAHGYNISELKTRQEVLSLIEEGIFERYIVLSRAKGPGTLEEIIEGNSMKMIYGRDTL
ncbi:MAG: stage III sporulation protein AA [Clostridia bacterium]|nr:stage III sporulation protein AA [Clostridia bacterium]